MNNTPLAPTSEQQAVITHPLRHHARVLAVAGSGKTTTIVLRVAHLINELGVNPSTVRVFAYNALARNELRARIEAVLPDKRDQPRVDTFHSFCFRWIKQAISTGLLVEPSEWWLDEATDRSRILMYRALQSLVGEGIIEEGAVDIDAVASAITLWKSGLIPPGGDRAAHATSSDIPLVYSRFEEFRQEAGALGFDDFVDTVLSIAHAHPEFWQRAVGHLRVVIVDEYQDVNYGQERLVEAVAGTHADVMVVGDDDQTIYEWRGARPDYLLTRFGSGLAERPIIDYPLTVSFRFGPLLAQTAYNVIARNAVRFPKALVASQWHQTTVVDVVEDKQQTAGVIDTQLALQLQDWVRQHGAQTVVVLGRTLGQLQSFEIACLLAGIPYRVLGRGPVYQRREHQILADYLHIGYAYDVVVDAGVAACFLRIINTPMRGLARDRIQQMLSQAQLRGLTIRAALQELHTDAQTPQLTKDRIDQLMALCEHLVRMLATEASAYDVLSWLSTTLRLDEHFVRSFGRGEAAAERTVAIRQLVAVASHLGWSPPAYLDWLAQSDHTAGHPEEQQVLFTTVYRAKGLEYDAVFIPSAVEGYMPAAGSSPEVFDRLDPTALPVASDAIEEERRLFYVAITRAKTLLTIGIPLPQPGLGRDALPSSTPSRFVYEMKVTATEQILASADSDASALAEAFAEHGASDGLLAHLRQYFPQDAEIRQICDTFSGTRWPMRPLKPKKK
jgi:DNA helicase-2/ATP-dependent DNA helicase PcrA